MPRYPIAIIGPGALGLVFGRRLSRHMRVALIARSEGRARELRAGVTVDDAAFVPEVHAAGNPPAADWILVLVKAADTRAAAEIAARMSPRGVLSLQNGWVEELLREPLAGVLAAQGVTTEAGRETEVEFLTGALLKMASAHGVAAPTHQALYRFLLALESRSSQDRLADAGRRREGSWEGSQR